MEYSRRTSEEILEVRKKYTQFIYYHCVDIYIIIYIFILSFHSNWRLNGGSKRSYDVTRSKQFKRHCQDFLWIRSWIPRARTTMTLKNSYLVAKRWKIRVARNPKDMSTFVNLLCTYFMHAQPLEIFVYRLFHTF